MSDHPVWEIYNEIRDAKYYLKAYTYKSGLYVIYQKVVDICIAVFTPSSALSGIFFWDDQKILIGVLVSFASVLAIVKPFLKLEDNIRQYRNSSSAWNSVSHKLQDIVIEIKRKKSIDDEIWKRFYAVRDEIFSVSKKTVALNLSLNRRIKIQEEVNRKNPMNLFFVPDV